MLLLLSSEVDGGDEVGPEEDVVDATDLGWPKGDGLLLEGAGEADNAALEADALVVDAARLVVGSVGEVLDGVLVGPGAERVTLDGSGHVEGFVRPDVVVDAAPALELAVGLVDVLERRAGEDFGLE